MLHYMPSRAEHNNCKHHFSLQMVPTFAIAQAASPEAARVNTYHSRASDLPCRELYIDSRGFYDAVLDKPHLLHLAA
jgi:hypothetical protein